MAPQGTPPSDRNLSPQTASARRMRRQLLARASHYDEAAERAVAHMPAWAREHLPALRASKLLSGLSDTQIAAALPCLGAQPRHVTQGEYLLIAGDVINRIYVILEGGVNIVQEDWWGNRNIIADEGPGDSFAEAYAFTPQQVDISVVATRPTLVVSLEANAVISTCQAACPFHARLMENLVQTLCERNLRLNDKLSYLSQRTTREKLLAYLVAQSHRADSASFSIPFDRQQLADFLSVNRSALSTELGKMRDEGLLEFRRNAFTLHLPTSDVR